MQKASAEKLLKWADTQAGQTAGLAGLAMGGNMFRERGHLVVG